MLRSLGSVLVLPYSKGSWKMLAATLGKIESLVTQITAILRSSLFFCPKRAHNNLVMKFVHRDKHLHNCEAGLKLIFFVSHPDEYDRVLLRKFSTLPLGVITLPNILEI